MSVVDGSDWSELKKFNMAELYKLPLASSAASNESARQKREEAKKVEVSGSEPKQAEKRAATDVEEDASVKSVN